MVTKKKVLKSLQEMPERFSIDELMDKLILIQKVENGLNQSEKGEVYSTEESRQLLKQWS